MLPQVDVLVELSPDRKQQAPQGYMVWYPRKPHCAKKNGIVRAEFLDTVIRHHLACLSKIFAGPGVFHPLDVEPEQASRLVKHPDALGHYLLANAVAG